MRSDLVLAGVGGQGILTIAAIIGRAAVGRGLNVKQSEIHGMSQRGGDVVAHLRLSDAPIAADVISPGCADVVLGMEPMEALRHAKYLDPARGVVVYNSAPVRNVADYPDTALLEEELGRLPRAVALPGDDLARQAAGSARAVNMVLLGAVSVFLDLPSETLAALVARMFAPKGDDVVQANLKAFQAGKDACAQR